MMRRLPLLGTPLKESYPKRLGISTKNKIGRSRFPIPADIIEVVMGKPISYLRNNKDTAERVKALKNRLKELKAFDPIKYTEEIINQL